MTLQEAQALDLIASAVVSAETRVFGSILMRCGPLSVNGEPAVPDEGTWERMEKTVAKQFATVATREGVAVAWPSAKLVRGGASVWAVAMVHG